MKFEMVRNLKLQRIDVKISCEVLGVSRGGYYAWSDRPESERTKENRELVGKMRRIHDESRGTYGAPRLTARLNGDGHGCSRGRVARLMRQAGLEGVARRRYRVRT